jgi:general stress protein 26
MKPGFIRFIIIIPVILLVSASSLTAQEDKEKISRDSLLSAARIIAESATCRVLITVDETGKPHARAMAPFTPEENWMIWLGTSHGSRKTEQIQNNPNVIVYYYETAGLSYVSVTGKARLVNDQDKKSKYWVDAWSAFYKDVANDYVLIEVTPEILEIFSLKYNLYDHETQRPLSVDFIIK